MKKTLALTLLTVGLFAADTPFSNPEYTVEKRTARNPGNGQIIRIQREVAKTTLTQDIAEKMHLEGKEVQVVRKQTASGSVKEYARLNYAGKYTEEEKKQIKDMLTKDNTRDSKNSVDFVERKTKSGKDTTIVKIAHYTKKRQ